MVVKGLKELKKREPSISLGRMISFKYFKGFKGVRSVFFSKQKWLQKALQDTDN